MNDHLVEHPFVDCLVADELARDMSWGPVAETDQRVVGGLPDLGPHEQVGVVARAQIRPRVVRIGQRPALEQNGPDSSRAERRERPPQLAFAEQIRGSKAGRLGLESRLNGDAHRPGRHALGDEWQDSLAPRVVQHSIAVCAGEPSPELRAAAPAIVPGLSAELVAEPLSRWRPGQPSPTPPAT